MPKVWITNYAGHDYAAAKHYGEFEFITKGYVSFQSLDRVKYQIAEQVAKSDKDDWILISGRPIISCVAILIWFQLHKQVKILNWDQKSGGTYRELVITERNLDEILNVLAIGPT